MKWKRGVILNKRIVEIIKLLLQKETEYSIFYFSKKYHVSERTIRNDFSVINDTLSSNGLKKISFGTNGKIICRDDFTSIQQYIPEGDFYSYKLSKEERKLIVCSLLINASEYITLSAIADYLSVSRATIISNLDEIKRFLKKNHLTVLSHSNKGLRLEGLESDKRKLLMQIAQYNWSIDYNSQNKLGIQAGNIVTIQKILNEQEHFHGYYLTDDSFHQVQLYLRIMIQRNQQGEYIEKVEETGSHKYRMAQDILKYVTQYCENISTENEIIFFSKLLDNCQYMKRKVTENDMIKIQLLTRRFIEAISDELGINLNNDYDFYENLSNHLESIFKNNNLNLIISPIQEEVVAKNKEVMKAVIQQSKILENYVEREILQSEQIYIVMHICAAIERQKNKDIAFHVILVCHAGIGTSQLLLARLKQHFKFKIVDIISAHEAENITKDQADLLITTVDLGNKVPIESVKVSPLLHDEDYIRVGAKIDALRNSLKLPVREEKKEITAKTVLERIKPILYKEIPENAEKISDLIKKDLFRYFKIIQREEGATEVFSPSLHHLLSENYIELDVVCKDWQEAVKKSAEILLQKGYIEENYIQAIIDNIIENGPYIIISQGFALPHEGLDRGTIKTGMSLIRLKTPIVFDEEYDPIEFVCCLSAVDHKIHLKSLFHLINMLQHENFKKAMRKAVTKKEMAEIIERYEYELNDM